MPAKIRVLCVDDHRIVREGLGLIINRQPDMEVVASAASGEESVGLFQHYRPDVTLMDLQLCGMSGVEAIRSIREQDVVVRARDPVAGLHHGQRAEHFQFDVFFRIRIRIDLGARATVGIFSPRDTRR